MAAKLKRATDEKFRKRTNNIFKKGDELRSLCEVDVYILLHRKGVDIMRNSIGGRSQSMRCEILWHSKLVYRSARAAPKEILAWECFVGGKNFHPGLIHRHGA